jgi:flagellar basal-body rod modification protein FlgD
MSDVTSTTTTPQTTADIVAATNKKLGADTTQNKQPGTIGKDDFLKLLVGQLQHQDPMQPADDSQFIGQMAQFSQLEQETNSAQSTSQIATQLGHATALSLIGRTVSYTDDNDATQTGAVQQVDVTSDGSATLTVGGVRGVALSSVTEIR